jgi:cytidylate kinase
MDEVIKKLRYHGNVCISGLTASGKTTHSHLLAGEFGLTYVSGSQIQLNFMGVSPIQTKDFWITPEAKAFWDGDQFNRIDDELLRLESIGKGFVFDTSTMPWRHKHPSLCIWLESSLESRVTKSIVSHRGNSQYTPAEYPDRIREKDRATTELYKGLYSIDIGTDLSCFDLILDITKLIQEPTLNASLSSIEAAHTIIRPAVGWYLTGERKFRNQLVEAVGGNPKLVLRNTLLGGENNDE